MGNTGGFVTLHRRILDWEWYTDSATKDVFLHLLLTANYTDFTFRGRVIKRGQVVTSLPSISTGTGLSIQQARTALKHLESTGEITDEATCQYRIITIVKYNDYQNATDDLTGNQQAINRRSNRQSTDELTVNQQGYNNNNNINKAINKQGNKKERRSDGRSEELFNVFWNEYPKKVAKQDALKAWMKIKPGAELVNQIMTGLARCKASAEWAKSGGQFIPHAATWLNGKRWEDDVSVQPVQASVPVPVRTVNAQQYSQRDYKDADQEAYERMMANNWGLD